MIQVMGNGKGICDAGNNSIGANPGKAGVERAVGRWLPVRAEIMQKNRDVFSRRKH